MTTLTPSIIASLEALADGVATIERLAHDNRAKNASQEEHYKAVYELLEQIGDDTPCLVRGTPMPDSIWCRIPANLRQRILADYILTRLAECKQARLSSILNKRNK